jgi:hypothetical protein
MRNVLICSIAMTIALAAGCNNAKSPDAVANNVATAEQKAATEVQNSENAAAKDMGKAADKVDDKMADLNNTAAKDAYDVVVAQADGNRKVALAQCSALGGEAQKNCKDQAESDYKAAKAGAKSAETSEKQ